MRVSSSEVLGAAESTGFQPVMVEKVLRLLHLLNALNSHPFLDGKWALKGGTALNLFVFDVPRLSVDIDINYVGPAGRDQMMEERGKIEEALAAVFSREGLEVKKAAEEHAGGKWRLGYEGFDRQPGNLEVDLNFMFREPLWGVDRRDSRAFGAPRAEGIPVLDLHELAAGKLAALFSRGKARDLFDCHCVLSAGLLDRERLRIAFVVYGALNRRDWRSVCAEDVNCDPQELARQLLPTLDARFAMKHGRPEEYAARLVSECRRAVSVVLPFTEAERRFLDLVLDHGRIEPELLTSDTALQVRIRRHPMLRWKAHHVRQYKNLP